MQTERYRAGISTALDQLTSQLALTQAELGLVAARYNYQVTRASLEALVGRTLCTAARREASHVARSISRSGARTRSSASRS